MTAKLKINSYVGTELKLVFLIFETEYSYLSWFYDLTTVLLVKEFRECETCQNSFIHEIRLRTHDPHLYFWRSSGPFFSLDKL